MAADFIFWASFKATEYGLELTLDKAVQHIQVDEAISSQTDNF